MQVTVLGKYGPYAPAGGATSSYLVQEGNTSVALDFGSGAMGRLQNKIGLTDLNAIVLSHLHYDHISDLFALSYYYDIANKKIDLIMPCDGGEIYKLLKSLSAYNVIPARDGITVGELSFNFKQMIHPVTSNAIKVSSANSTLCYSGDTAYCDALPEFADGSDLLILDCGKAENSQAPHLSLREAERIADKLNIKTIASHLNPALQYNSANRLVTVAQESMTYNV